MEGEDGALDSRHQWDLGFWHEQTVLNTAILPDQAVGGCVHVRPPGDFFSPPGTLLRHFTGPCPLSSPYDEHSAPPSSALRKCKCFLSQFGAKRVAALLQFAPSLQQTACATYEREVRLPLSEQVPNGTLRVLYIRHCYQKTRRKPTS